MKTKYARLLSVFIIILIAVSSFAIKPAQASSFTIISPQDVSYGQKGAQWWQWLFSIPVGISPMYTNPALMDDSYGNVDCSVGQKGKVWFLAGTATADNVGNDVIGSAIRTCNIPANISLFFPVINSECSTLEGYGTKYKDLLSCAISQAGAASVLEVKIDGVQVVGLNPSNSYYRAHSGMSSFTLPDDNLFQFWNGSDQPPAGTTSNFVSDGWWLMVAPLSTGMHTIYIHGEVPLSGGGNFILDVTYNLIVQAQ